MRTTYLPRHAAGRFVSCAAVLSIAALAFGAQPAPRQAQRASEHQPATAAGDDLAQLQGKWERGKYPGGPAPDAVRVVKEINGNRETVTYYDPSGNVLAATTAEFKVQAYGPVRVYTFDALRFTDGPRTGQSERQAVSYIYRVDGDALHEAHGLLANSPAGSAPAVVTWTRSKADATTAGAKSSDAQKDKAAAK